MPELPEVETVRRGLAPLLEGAMLAEVRLNRADLRFPFPERFVERLRRRRIEALERRAKYLLARLEGGLVLLTHLGMTGRFIIEPPEGEAAMPGAFAHEAGRHPQHDHVIFRLDSGAAIRFNDARRFGYMTLIEADELDNHPLLAGLGVEPTGAEFTAAYLAKRAKGRAAPLKSFLLDQRVVAGLGNIYVCEALYRARLHPMRAAGCLAERPTRADGAANRLVAAIRAVLCEAIAAGGSSLRDYRQANGDLGYFQHSFAVYGREGEPCQTPSCGGIIQRVVQCGRSSFYCPRCQRRTARAPASTNRHRRDT